MIADPQSIPEVEERLAGLAKDEAFRDFRPLVEGVLSVASSRQAELPALVEILKELLVLRSEVDGATTSEIIKRAHSVTFDNKNLTTEQFNQAQNIYVYNLGKLSDEAAPKPPVSVPVVLAVMSRDEAEALWDGTALADQLPSAGPDVQHVQEFLKASAADIDHYGPTPEEWRPFGTTQGDPTIDALVSSVVAEMNANSKYDPPLMASLRDVHGLVSNWSETLALRSDGCVLLVDGISMLHPAIIDSFRRSGLDLFPKVSIIRVDPRSGAWESTRNLKVVLRLELGTLEFARRSTEYSEDPFASFNASDATSLNMWLRSRVVTLHPPRSGGIRDHIRIAEA